MTERKIRLFLAQDFPMLRRGMSLLLYGETDIEVVGEADVSCRVVRKVQMLRPDVVVVDCTTPGFSVADFIRDLTEAVAGVAVVVLTANDDEGFLIETLATGAMGFVLKWEDAPTMMQAIRTVADGQKFICPIMVSKLTDDFLARLQMGVVTEPYSTLSTREREVLPLLAEGGTNQEIAESINVSPHTVATYRKRIMRKLDLHSRAEIVRYALRRGLIDITS